MSADLASHIRDIPDFPQPGILFKDITTLCKDGAAFQQAVQAMVEQVRGRRIDAVLAVEARGFIFGGAVATALGCGFVPVRKPGKLPAAVHSQTYDLEYGTDTIAMHQDALDPGSHVIIVDDLLATGGTVGAVVELLKQFDNVTLEAIVFLIELTFLNGREKLAGQEIISLISY